MCGDSLCAGTKRPPVRAAVNQQTRKPLGLPTIPRRKELERHGEGVVGIHTRALRHLSDNARRILGDLDAGCSGAVTPLSGAAVDPCDHPIGSLRLLKIRAGGGAVYITEYILRESKVASLVGLISERSS